MPELPEVETVRRGLHPYITGNTVLECRVRRGDLRSPVPADFAERLTGATLTGTGRRSKYLLLHLSTGDSAVIHLGMSGKLIYTPLAHGAEPPPPAKHDHILFRLPEAFLVFNDARRFGRADILRTEDLASAPYLAALGPEPLDGRWTPEQLGEKLTRTSRPVKTAIMDAAVVVGVGNIYASESLYAARIHPLRPANQLEKSEIEILHTKIIAILESAIASGGSTLRDYVRSSGEAGYFQHAFKVYGKHGTPCDACGNMIAKTVTGNRSTFYCEYCQR